MLKIVFLVDSNNRLIYIQTNVSIETNV